MSKELNPLTYHREPEPRKRHAPTFVELTTATEEELNRLEAFLFHRIIELATPEVLDLIYAHGDVMSVFDHDTDRTLTLGEWRRVTQRARALIGEA